MSLEKDNELKTYAVDLGGRISCLRQGKSITQSELGEILNIGKTTISMYENGNSVQNDIIKLKISKYFNTSLDWLIGNFKQEDIHKYYRNELWNKDKEILELRQTLQNIKSIIDSKIIPNEK